MAADLHIQKLVKSKAYSPPPETPRRKNPSGHPEDPNPTAPGPPPGFDEPPFRMPLEKELRRPEVLDLSDFNIPFGLRQELAKSKPAEDVHSARTCDIAAVEEPATHEEGQMETQTDEESENEDVAARAEAEAGRYLYRKIGEIMREKVS